MIKLFSLKNYIERGFTLPELLIATAILACVLCGMLLFFVNCTLLNELSRDCSIATTHAEYILEDIRNEGFDAAQGNGDNWTWDTDTIVTALGAALKNEEITTNISSTEPLTITVNVTWQDRRARGHSLVMNTMLSDEPED
jgi:prepilin-type N-terminal cleavage/methylation domain-containing protein